MRPLTQANIGTGFFKPVFFINGLVLVILAVTMLIPATVDLIADSEDILLFPSAAGITLFAGGSLFFGNYSVPMQLSRHQIILITVSVWVVVPLFAALPFDFGPTRLSLTNAIFESMSGMTTTGSTVITEIDALSPGIQLWRGILQWLGGLGIMVVSFGILPVLQVGGMEIFRIEAFDIGEKIVPRIAVTAVWLVVVYIVLTVTCGVLLRLAGMTGLEATVHALTTIATGGFSTSDQSISHFDSALIEAIITGGMIAGGLPFMLILAASQGNVRKLFTDSQVRWYFGILSAGMMLVSAWLFLKQGMPFGQAFRYASFQIASIMTGTGFASTDYQQWGPVPVILLFFLTFVGGCTGSTACGIKVFRVCILVSVVNAELKKVMSPHGVFPAFFNSQPVQSHVAKSVLVFLAAFLFIFALITLGLGLTGLDFTTAISSAATAISNVGPGLGSIVGPAGNFASLPDAAKWLLIAGMLIGRLEVITVIALLTQTFWQDV